MNWCWMQYTPVLAIRGLRYRGLSLFLLRDFIGNCSPVHDVESCFFGAVFLVGSTNLGGNVGVCGLREWQSSDDQKTPN